MSKDQAFLFGGVAAKYASSSYMSDRGFALVFRYLFVHPKLRDEPLPVGKDLALLLDSAITRLKEEPIPNIEEQQFEFLKQYLLGHSHFLMGEVAVDASGITEHNFPSIAISSQMFEPRMEHAIWTFAIRHSSNISSKDQSAMLALVNFLTPVEPRCIRRKAVLNIATRSTKDSMIFELSPFVSITGSPLKGETYCALVEEIALFKNIFPPADLRFGDSYDLCDEALTEMFNVIYIKSFIIGLLDPLKVIEKEEFETIYRSLLESPTRQQLIEANRVGDFGAFRAAWYNFVQGLVQKDIVPLVDVSVNYKKDEWVIPPASTGYCGLAFHILDEVEVGRPLFESLCNSRSANTKSAAEQWQDMLNYAESEFSALPEDDNYEPYAILAAKYSVKYKSKDVNEKLISNNLALGLHLSADKLTIQAGYLGEPLISEVVSRKLLRSQETFAKHLTLLHDLLNTDKCIKPDVGKLVPAIYLGLARDSLLCWAKDMVNCDSSETSGTTRRICDPSPLSFLLRRLVPRLAIGQLVSQDLLNSFVAYAAFVEVTKCNGPLIDTCMEERCTDVPDSPSDVLVTRQLLHWAWRSRVALYLPSASAPVDIVIPMILGKPCTEAKEPMHADESNVSAIVVHVENKPYELSFNEIESTVPAIGQSKIFEEGLVPAMGLVLLIEAGNYSNTINCWLHAASEACSFPVLVLSAKHLQTALMLPRSITDILNSIVNQDSISQMRIQDPPAMSDCDLERQSNLLSRGTVQPSLTSIDDDSAIIDDFAVLSMSDA